MSTTSFMSCVKVKYHIEEIHDPASPVTYNYKFLTIALIVPRFFMMNFPVDSSALHVDWVMWILLAATMKVSGKHYWQNSFYQFDDTIVDQTLKQWSTSLWDNFYFWQMSSRIPDVIKTLSKKAWNLYAVIGKHVY